MAQSKSRNTKILALSCVALLSTACTSYAGNYGLGGTVGTTGIGVEGKMAVSDNLALRGTLTTAPINRDATIDDVDYEADLNFTNVGGFADLYPFQNGFHISGGAYAGEKSMDLVGTPGAATTVEIGGTTYTGAQIGTLTGDVSYNDIAPFVGIGYDGFMKRSSDWSFNARAGVMFVGSPDVDLTAAGGLISASPMVQAELQNEITNLEAELDDYKYYPVVTLGITRRF